MQHTIESHVVKRTQDNVLESYKKQQKAVKPHPQFTSQIKESIVEDQVQQTLGTKNITKPKKTYKLDGARASHYCATAAMLHNN